MKRFLIAFLLVLGLNPCTSYAFEKTDICFQYGPEIQDEFSKWLDTYIEEANIEYEKTKKGYEIDAIDFFIQTFKKAIKNETGVVNIPCDDLAKVCNTARWSAKKSLDFYEELKVLWKLLAVRVMQKTGDKTLPLIPELMTESKEKNLAKSICDMSALQVANKVDRINGIKTYNGHKKNEYDIFQMLQMDFFGSFRYQECFKAYGYFIDDDLVIKKK